MPVEDRQVALVTGAAKRLGAVMARVLHSRGYRVIIHFHRSSSAARALVDDLNQIRADSAISVQQDLTAEDAALTLADSIRRNCSRLDLLVNNASVFDKTPLNEIDVSTWDRIQAINVRAPYFLSIHAAEWLRRSSGSIVNIADIQGERPRLEYSAYCASKAGILAVTRSLAIDMAPLVRVNCVSPGAILWANNESEAVKENTIRSTPLQRHGTPEDIAEAVCYLAQARFVTGHTLNVDGGRIVRI
ncbi:MAG: pteridine reductase [Gammaproteobacteria bacterium]|nr:pteridine reductase [Gammaproteobacteria bacterium]